VSAYLRTILLSMLVLSAVSFAQISPAAYADNGGPWAEYPGNPILAPTPGGWDSDQTIAPRVIFDGMIFRMWYVGSQGGATGIGYANSTDGLTWRKYPGPVLLPGSNGSWDSGQVGLGSVLWNGTRFLMWYRGSGLVAFPHGAIGLATSPDGITWTKYPDNPVLKPTEIDQKYIASPFTIRMENTYNMWYTGKSKTDPDAIQITRILYAWSFDGVKWYKWTHPVLGPSAEPNAWDNGSVFSPSVLYDGTNFGMWYSGLNQTRLGPRIGYATSPDGATWSESGKKPILNLGAPGSWDSGGVEQPSIVIGYGYMLYYDGFSNTGGRIGLATAPQGFSIPEFPLPTMSLLLGAVVFAAIFLTRSRRRR